MPHPKLKIVALSGSELTPATLQAMCDFRRSIMHMKPDVDLSRDFDKFCRFCRHAGYVYLLYAPDQQLVGSVVFAADENTASDGTRYVFAQAEYLFMAPAYRGHMALPMALMRLLLRFVWYKLLYWRNHQVWVCGIGYPASVMLFYDLVDNAYLGGGPEAASDMPLIAREIIQKLVQDSGPDDWDAVRGRAIMPTVPPIMPPHWYEKMENNRFFQEYTKRCPDWREGFALPGAGRMHWHSSLWRILTKGLRRKLQRG